MKHVFVDQMTGKTIKEINLYPINGRPAKMTDFLTLNGERYAYVHSDRHVDENRKDYMVVIVTKVIPYSEDKVESVPFTEHKSIARLKTSPDGKGQIFTCIEGKVFHRSKVSELKWSAWTQYV